MSEFHFKAGRIWFGQGSERWSVPDVTDPIHDKARHHARYGEPPNYSVAEQAETLVYLLATCPTTEAAVQQLRAIRRALKAKQEAESFDG